MGINKPGNGEIQERLAELPPVGEPIRSRSMPPLPPDGMRSGGGGSGWRWALGCGVLALVVLCAGVLVPYAIGWWLNASPNQSSGGIKPQGQQVLPSASETPAAVIPTATPTRTTTPATPTPAPSSTATASPPAFTEEQLQGFVLDIDHVVQQLPGSGWQPDQYMETDVKLWSDDAAFIAKLPDWNYQGSLFSSYYMAGGGGCPVTFCAVVSIAMLFQTPKDAQSAYTTWVEHEASSLNVVDGINLPKSFANYTETCMWGESGSGFFFACSGVTGNLMFNLGMFTAATPSQGLEQLGLQIYLTEYHTSPGLQAE